MIDLDEDAVANAGAMAGEYLDELRKTDLATLTPDEWAELMRVVICGYFSRHNSKMPF